MIKLKIKNEYLFCDIDMQALVIFTGITKQRVFRSGFTTTYNNIYEFNIIKILYTINTGSWVYQNQLQLNYKQVNNLISEKSDLIYDLCNID